MLCLEDFSFSAKIQGVQNSLEVLRCYRHFIEVPWVLQAAEYWRYVVQLEDPNFEVGNITR